MKRQNLSRTVRLNEAGMRLYAPSHAAQPWGEEWWKRARLTIAAANSREFQQLMHACLRAASNWAQVARLREDNAVLIVRLDRATREDVLSALANREKELQTHG